MKYKSLSNTNHLINNTFPVVKTLETREGEINVEIVKIKELGKALLINKELQLIDSQAHKYHEPISHTPNAYIEKPKTALILGGGDGGISFELLKYDSIEQITIVEFSEEVTELSKKHFKLFASSLNDKKVKLIFDNAKDWLEGNKETFDLIFIDTTEFGADTEFTYKFRNTSIRDEKTLGLCKEALNKNGILTINHDFCGVENFSIFSRAVEINNNFTYCKPFISNIPYFPAQSYSFFMASDDIDFDNHIIKWKNVETIFYNRETHLASLALDEEIKSIAEISTEDKAPKCSTTLIDLKGVDEKLIDNETEVVEIMKQACDSADLNIIKISSHKFEPQGVTISILLKESHFTCHSWPENSEIFFDLNTCGDVGQARSVANFLVKEFKPKTKSIKNTPRY